MTRTSDGRIFNAWNEFHDRWFSECESDEERLKLIDEMISRMKSLKRSIVKESSDRYHICKNCGTIYKLKIPYCKVCQSRMEQ